MKIILFFSFSLFFVNISISQNANNKGDNDIIYPTEFHLTEPLRELVKKFPFVENKVEKESEDKKYRIPQTFLFTAEDGAIYGEDISVRQTVMGNRKINSNKAIIMNWAGQTSGSRPQDPTGAAGPNHYVQIINATPFKVYDKITGASLLTANISTLWSPATSNDGDPILMYDKYADRWFVSQFGTSGNKIYIAISTTNDPTGSYYAYTFTSPQFPDYLKFSIWENGYYMTSNQSTDKVFCFERDQMLVGNASARAVSANFTTGSVSSFFVPLPADAADGGLPVAGTPLPFFCYTENSWGGGNIDGVKIWNMTVNWGTTPSASISLNTTIPTSAFDGTYNTSWNDIPQPGTTQMLDGIGGVPTFRAQWRPWNGYNTVVLNWGVKLSATQRSIRWVELRQDQSTGSWSLYQESTYAPDADSRWMGSIAMDDNGSIGLAYCKSSSSTYPTLCYTGRVATDPLGLMSFTEVVAAVGTSSQSGLNRYGDYSHTALDPDGITFWHTGEYISGSVKTRIYSFQLPVPTTPPNVDFSVNQAISCSGIVKFTDLSSDNPISWLWDFGDGQTSTIQNPTHAYLNSGSYSVTLTSTNGIGSNQIVKSNFIIVNIPSAPIVTVNHRCGAGTVDLFATGTGTIHWFSVPTGGTEIGVGNSFTTPSISSTTTYYTENHTEQSSQFVGPTNDSLNGSFTITSTYLTFDCYTACNLVSVSVNANGAANRTFELKNSSNVVLQTVTTNVPTGVSRVVLNFNIPVGTGLRLNVTSNSQLYRLNSGFAFPYTLSGIIRITGCSTLNRYGLVYDWEIKETDCVSERLPVDAIVDSLPPIANYSYTSNQLDASFTSTSTGADMYYWDFGDSSSSLNQNPTHTYVNAGIYSVMLIVSSNCGVDTIIQMVNVIGMNISNNTLNSKINIYPNPTTGNLSVYSLNNYENITIVIENYLGKILYITNTNLLKNSLKTIDLNSFSNGIYFIKIYNSKLNYKQKIIKIN